MNEKHKHNKKVIFSNLDGIYKSSAQISKAIGIDKIALITLKNIIEGYKFKEISGVEAQDVFNKEYAKVLDQLYVACVAISKEGDGKRVTLVYLKMQIDQLKRTFTYIANKK